MFENEMSDLAFVDSQLSAADAAPAADATPAAEPAAEAPVTNTPAESGVPVEGEQTQPEGEPAEGEPTAEGTEAEEEPLFEDLSVGALNKKLEANPTLKAELEKDPATRNLVFTALRRSAKLDSYEQIFTNPETAKFTLDTANEMVEFDRMFRSEDTQDSESFLQALHFNSLLRDEEGNVQVDGNGMPVSSGAYERIMGTYRNFMWNEVAARAQRDGDEELAEAVRVIRTKVEGQPAAGAAEAAPQKTEGLPVDVQAKLRRLDEIEKRDRETARSSQGEFVKSVNVEIDTKVSEEVSKLVSNITKRENIALSDYERKNVIRDSVEAVKKNIGANTAYKNMLSTLLQTTGRTPEGRTKISNHAMASIKQSLPRIVASNLSTATQNRVVTAKARQDKINAQTARREPLTTGGASRGQSLPDIKTVIAAAEQAKKRPLSDSEMADIILEQAQAGQ